MRSCGAYSTTNVVLQIGRKRTASKMVYEMGYLHFSRGHDARAAKYFKKAVKYARACTAQPCFGDMETTGRKIVCAWSAPQDAAPAVTG